MTKTLKIMLKIKTFTFNMFGVNTYLIWNPDTREAAVIDPGMINEDEEQQLDNFIESHRLRLTHLINTHMHVDHIFGDLYIKNKYGLDVTACEDDAFLGERAATQCRMFGLPDNMAVVEIDRRLSHGDTIDICGEKVEVLGVPGHSPGSIVLYFPESRWAITGDVLFRGSIGRTDLVGGNHQLLIDGIRNKVFKLPENVTVYPGHGLPTDIGYEQRHNPFV